jgi:hypothetical protein
MTRPKPRCESLAVTQQERAALVALAEVLREIFLQRGHSTLETKPIANFDDIPDSTLTGRGTLLQ